MAGLAQVCAWVRPWPDVRTLRTAVTRRRAVLCAATIKQESEERLPGWMGETYEPVAKAAAWDSQVRTHTACVPTIGTAWAP